MLQPERGQLKVSMYANSGLLTVSVGQARNLQSKWQTKCNSYVKVLLFPEDEQTTTKCKTVLVKNNNCPSFEEKFSFELLEEDLKKRILISVWHKEPKNGRSEFLGCMSFGVQHIISNRRIVNGWYYLLTEKLGKRKHLQVPAQPDNVDEYDPSLIPSINQGVNWMEPHVFVLKKEAEEGFGFEVTGYGPARVAYVQTGSVAESMGLQAEDCIVRMNGSNVSRSGEESISRVIRGCEKQLILEIHRPRRSTAHPSADVSFVRGSDATSAQPIRNEHGGSQPISSALYEEIYDMRSSQRNINMRPQPCGKCDHDDSTLYDHNVPIQNQIFHPNMRFGNNNAAQSQYAGSVCGRVSQKDMFQRRSYDDMDVHTLSPIVSPDENRFNLQQRQSEPMFIRHDKFNFISQWRDNVQQTFHENLHPFAHKQQNNTLASNPAISQSNSSTHPRKKAYESEDCRGMRWNERKVYTDNNKSHYGTTRRSQNRAYESEDCRGMRWSDRHSTMEKYGLISNQHLQQQEQQQNRGYSSDSNRGMSLRDQRTYSSSTQSYDSANQIGYIPGNNTDEDQLSPPSEDLYIPMYNNNTRQVANQLHFTQMNQNQANLQQHAGKHLQTIQEEENEESALYRKYQLENAHAQRVMDLKMASHYADYSPPYMKTKTKKIRNKAKSETERIEDGHEHKENSTNTKRQYQPIGEEETKFKSKRVLQPIGEENTKDAPKTKHKSIFGFCGGMNLKNKSKNTI